MKGSWQSGTPRMQFQFGQGKRPGFFTLIVIAFALGLFLVFGIGLLMIAATLLVLMLPWLWWKKRKLIARMQQAQAAYQAQQQDPAASGVIIEGEVVQREPAQSSSATTANTQKLYVQSVTIEQDQSEPVVK
jgi:Zn-dependent protease with chaperone function